jgi:RimJ/RimL family protein N-acetyltransferase
MVLVIALDLTGVNVPTLGPVCIALIAAIFFAAWLRARSSMRAWRADSRNPLVLAAPFEGRWFVAVGGPAPGLNHHLIASDQRFAYDFVRRDAKSFGSTILAPCEGVVVSVENEMPDLPPSRNPDRPESRGRELGNHVGIETERGTVFLCHLRAGSVSVAVGDHVTVGAPIGACGNSGRTTFSHLHVHAQSLRWYAFNEATGVPIAFTDQRGMRVLRIRETLHGPQTCKPISVFGARVTRSLRTNMMNDPISSDRLLLEPLVEAHATELFDRLQDARIYEFTDQIPPTTLEELRATYRQRESRFSPDRQSMWLNWVIKLKEDSVYIGFVQATLGGNGIADIGYVVFPDMWGNGYGTEAVKTMIEGLTTHGMTRFCADVHARNLPSIKLLQRLGFTEQPSGDEEDRHFALLWARPSN